MQGNRRSLFDELELIKVIWPNIVVTDESLAHCVSEVRQALGDSKQTIITTMPRRGYLFAAPVVRLVADASAAPQPAYAPPHTLEGRVGGCGSAGLT